MRRIPFLEVASSRHVKAHRSRRQAQLLSEADRFDFEGNSHVDYYAKEGAWMHGRLPPDGVCLSVHKKLAVVAKHIATALSLFPTSRQIVKGVALPK